MKKSKLKIKYEKICNKYIKKFSKKHEIEFDGWIGDEVGGIASFISQYFFNLSDIILDIETEQPSNFILEWQEDGTDYNIKNKIQEFISYNSYIMGLRYNMLNK